MVTSCIFRCICCVKGKNLEVWCGHFGCVLCKVNLIMMELCCDDGKGLGTIIPILRPMFGIFITFFVFEKIHCIFVVYLLILVRDKKFKY